MRIIKSLVLLLLSFSILSCSTKYQETGFTGGFSETRLDLNIWRVSFKGNGYTNREKTSDFVLLRAAELTIDKGFSYFIIYNSDSHTTTSAYTTSASSNTTFNAYSTGDSVYGTANTRHSGGDTVIVNKPTSELTIACFTDPPESGVRMFDAEFVQRSIRAKYNMEIPVSPVAEVENKNNLTTLKPKSEQGGGAQPKPPKIDLRYLSEDDSEAAESIEVDTAPEYIAELKALAKLRDEGVISEGEFQKQKDEILARN